MPEDKGSKLSGEEQEIYSTLLDTGAVNFEAIGSALARFGPKAAIDLDGDDVFCLTMKRFLHLFRLPYRLPGGPLDVEQLAGLRDLGRELRG